MSQFTDRNYLTKEQYQNSSNLDTRLNIHKRFSTNSYGWFNFVFDELSLLPANAHVLEVGCGTGELWRECADKVPAGWAITLTDLSEGMLDSAWRNLIVTGRNIKFENADVQSLPYEDKTFDAVIANHMLYHVPDRKKALKGIERVLKDDGVLFASTVGVNHMKRLWDWITLATNGKQGMISLSFTLKNGQEQLQEFFPSVELKKYPDALRVTDISMLKAYIRSMTSTSSFQEEQFQLIEKELEKIIKDAGEIYIEKESGLFIASK